MADECSETGGAPPAWKRCPSESGCISPQSPRHSMRPPSTEHNPGVLKALVPTLRRSGHNSGHNSGHESAWARLDDKGTWRCFYVCWPGTRLPVPKPANSEVNAASHRTARSCQQTKEAESALRRMGETIKSSGSRSRSRTRSRTRTRTRTRRSETAIRMGRARTAQHPVQAPDNLWVRKHLPDRKRLRGREAHQVLSVGAGRTENTRGRRHTMTP